MHAMTMFDMHPTVQAAIALKPKALITSMHDLTNIEMHYTVQAAKP